ncbi:unnamed protein product [Caenorhabditis brenneri]
MNRRTLCILFVIVACFSIVLSKEYKDLTAEEHEAAEVREELEGSMKDSNQKRDGSAKNAAPTGNFSTATSSEDKESGKEKKPDESATPAKEAPSTDSFFTIGLYSDTANAL